MKLKTKILPGPCPTPPECRLICSCGYTSTKSEFEKEHKHCFPEIIVATSLILLGMSTLGIFIYTALNRLGVV